MIAEKMVFCTTPKETISNLDAIDGDACLVVGDDAGTLNVFELLAICNAIKQRGHVTVELRGVACPLIAMGADTVLMDQKSMLIVKAPFVAVIGGPAEFADAADLLDKTKEAMKNCYASRPQVDKDSIFAMLDDGEDHFLNATESQRLGVIDTIC